jgi:hypothetical protein
MGVKTGLGHAMWFVKHTMGVIETAVTKPFQTFTNNIKQPKSTKNHQATIKGKAASSSSSEESASNLQVIGVGFGRTGTVSDQLPIFYKHLLLLLFFYIIEESVS